MTQAIQKMNRSNSANLALVNAASNKMSLGELKELAAVYVESGSFPDLKNVAQAIVKIKAGEDLGFSPHVALAGIHFFQGKAVIGANLLASLIKDSGKYEYKIIQHDDTICSIDVMQLIGGEWRKMGVPVTYTIEDAVKGGLATKDNWKKFPKDMLFAAVIRQACRRYCADVLRGTPTLDHYGAEESAIDEAADFQAQGEIEQSPNIVDVEPVPVAKEVSERDALLDRITNTCKALNTAKDSIEWKKSELVDYSMMLFDLEALESIDDLNESQLTTLATDLEERLAETNAVTDAAA